MRKARISIVVVLLFEACSRVPATQLSSEAPSASGAPATRTPRNIFVVVFENHAYNQIIGSSRAPYFNALARRYGLATNYRAVSHPSLPNYLAMVGGSTFGITDDCTTCSVDAPNLGDQLDARQVGWKVYAEGLPRPCSQVPSSGGYAKRHNPFLYFDSIASDGARCSAHVVPLTQFPRDASAGSIPPFSFIVPNTCHDMHDCSIATGDAWLKSFVASLGRTAAWKNDGLLVVLFDEDDWSRSNNVATVIVSQRVRPGAHSGRAFNHYSLLRSIEDAYGVPPLQNARTATNIFKTFGA